MLENNLHVDFSHEMKSKLDIALKGIQKGFTLFIYIEILFIVGYNLEYIKRKIS